MPRGSATRAGSTIGVVWQQSCLESHVAEGREGPSPGQLRRPGPAGEVGIDGSLRSRSGLSPAQGSCTPPLPRGPDLPTSHSSSTRGIRPCTRTQPLSDPPNSSGRQRRRRRVTVLRGGAAQEQTASESQNLSCSPTKSHCAGEGAGCRGPLAGEAPTRTHGSACLASPEAQGGEGLAAGAGRVSGSVDSSSLE